eukprot:scaffold5837_cov67-Phaeocystis_antarctica.AAC.2
MVVPALQPASRISSYACEWRCAKLVPPPPRRRPNGSSGVSASFRVVALEPVDVVAVPAVRAIAQDLQTLGVRVTGHARQRDGAQDGSARDLVLGRAAVDPEEAVEPGRFGRPDWVDDAALDLMRVASRLQDARL